MPTYNERLQTNNAELAGIKQAVDNLPLSGGGIGLGITGAQVGDKIEVAAVDEKGVPTAWKPEGEFELIESVTLDKESQFTRTAEPDGTPYAFRELLIEIKLPSTGIGKIGSLELLAKSGWLAAFTPRDPRNNEILTIRSGRDGGLYHTTMTQTNVQCQGYSSYRFATAGSKDYQFPTKNNPLANIHFNYTFPKDTKITIKAVRA